MSLRFLPLAALLWAGLPVLPHQARAETFNTCQGFITTLPATITTQGVWCLRQDLSTAITSGAAITVNTNNVTIDCNDFKIGGLAAGNASLASGIRAVNRQNIGVRRCAFRGFHTGINLDGDAGHLVEDNLADNSLISGISVYGENSVVQRNRVFDTGGGYWRTTAINTRDADVLDNLVAGVFTAHGADGSVFGIEAGGAGVVVRGNSVRGLTGWSGYGIWATVMGRISDNHVVASPAIDGFAIYGNNDTLAGSSHCAGNQTGGFSIAVRACTDIGGNTHF
ncbi:NosD domain-containing protein [Luteimonas saliphila]|uniref:NosD domain-containing protein n=1 Tax=Luteimonas saliphila TaxID=2804919 RepID=UPI00192D556E|nr:NosD domain-containing protein [Luteimonas saliphila]